jgi:alpha-L-fucosidase 2
MTLSTDRRRFLALAAAAAAGAASPAAAGAEESEFQAAQDHQLRLWYPQPASEWLRALPIGNGRLGAMVFGGTASERLQLNEDTVWGGGPYSPANVGGVDQLAEIRRRVFAGDWSGAQTLINNEFMGTPLGELPYQVVGNLGIDFSGADGAANYYRELDLTTAVALTRYTAGGVTYTREVFASAPDQVIVVRLTASQSGRITFTADFDSLHTGYTIHSPNQQTIGLDATSQTVNGVTGRVRFRTLARAIATGGTVASSAGKLTVTGATAVTLLLSTGTNYTDYQNLTGDQNARALQPIQAAAGRTYADLRARHVADYQALFNRTSLDLGTTAAAANATDSRIANFAGGTDPQLVTLLFQFGRYLLISSSRPGTQPANLQGIWCEGRMPPWGSKYTININTEMNYWLAGPTNLIELTEPVLDMLDELAVAGAETAELQYGARGWVCHHNTDGWRGTAPVDGAFWGMWQTGGAWMALHIWEHYRFTGDTAKLRARYPVLKGAAQFFVDALVQDPSSGYLVTCPSNSPENSHHSGSTVCAGPTMDMQIIRDLFGAVASAADVLGTDAAFRDQVRALANRLVPNRTGAQGQLREWQADWDAGAPEQTHRHVSHLYGLHPSNQITPRGTPALAQAARVTLAKRGDGGTGWSLAWKINFWARLEDGARSYSLLRNQLTTERTAPNLFCLHPPFQIDGNFGATAGIAEWLLQSHAGEIRLLPALPPSLPNGSVRGLRARGGDTIGITWQNGQITAATLLAAADHPVRVSAAVPLAASGFQAADEDGLLAFDAEAGTEYRFIKRP